jgi:transcriptional regulator with XRE-family HTH domain
MTIKIKSNVKSLMTGKGLTTADLSKKTGLPHVAIVNACSERIEFTGLNVLAKIAAALDVPIKELFDEVNPARNQAAPRKAATGETSISSVTEQLISIIMKMKTTDKDKLLEKYDELKKSDAPKSSTSNVTTNLVNLIMTMSLEERCHLLGDFISYGGQTKRKFGRKQYFRPVPFTVNERLYHGSTRDISMGGVFIEIKEAKKLFNAGDKIKTNLEHPETLQHFNVSGTVVRVVNAGIGVAFDEHL